MQIEQSVEFFNFFLANCISKYLNQKMNWKVFIAEALIRDWKIPLFNQGSLNKKEVQLNFGPFYFVWYLINIRGVARNFLEGGSKPSDISVTMVGRRIKIWVAERPKL